MITRIGNGRIWYVPGFAPGKDEGFDGWKALLRPHRGQHQGQDGCTPILGSGLLEKLVGSSREIARRWADEANFAMSPQQREDLPQVTQYLSVMEGLTYPPKALEERLSAELGRRFGGPRGRPGRRSTTAHGQARQGGSRTSRMRSWRGSRSPIYVTTNADDQLRRALVETGKDPQVELCRWHSRPDYDWPPSVFGVEGISSVPADARPGRWSITCTASSASPTRWS